MKIKVFLFHRVSPQRDSLWDPISPERFDSMIKYISKKHHIVSLEDHILGKNESKTIQKQLASVVFDDGYKDFLNYALPVLKKYNCPASMYVVTNCVTNQTPPWTYTLDYHFLNSKKLTIQLDPDLLPGDLRIKTFNDRASKLKFAKAFKPYLKKIKNSQRLLLLEQILSSMDDVTVPSNLIMNWDELREIKNEGIEIGSHSVTHPLLAELESKSELINEIKNSGTAIEKNLGHFPRTLSYPIGSYNELVKQTAKECGYQLGLAVNQKFYDNSVDDLFEIPRVELYNQNFITTNLRIRGVIPKIKNWITQ